MKAYLPIIRDSPVYPVIYDSNGVVCSLPPIINGDHSKITLNTKNVYIECTALDLTKANIVLDTLVCMFSSYCAENYAVERTEVVKTDGSIIEYPSLNYRIEKVSPKISNDYVGINCTPDEMVHMLNRMYLRTSYDAKEDILSVQIPPTRHDILHACDIYEDIGTAYGYNKIKRVVPAIVQIGKQNSLNKLTEQIREQVAQAGFTEALTFTLVRNYNLQT